MTATTKRSRPSCRTEPIRMAPPAAITISAPLSVAIPRACPAGSINPTIGATALRPRTLRQARSRTSHIRTVVTSTSRVVRCRRAGPWSSRDEARVPIKARDIRATATALLAWGAVSATSMVSYFPFLPRSCPYAPRLLANPTTRCLCDTVSPGRGLGKPYARRRNDGQPDQHLW